MTETETLPPLEERRRKLIKTLRDGTYPDGQHGLFIYEEETLTAMPIGHCCIGVGLRVIDESLTTQAQLNRYGYQDFNHYYELTGNIETHLIAMNDGAARRMQKSGQERLVRRAGNPRSHAFIARWLEIVWGLS